MRSVKLLFVMVVCLIIMGTTLFALTPVFITGYRTNARVPLIAEAPDNSGLYYDIYAEAAKRMGVNLEIRREPKKRLINDMKAGTFDFYPGFTFSEERSEYAFFFPNYLPGGYTIVTRDDFPSYKNMKELKKILKTKVQLVELGGPTFSDHVSPKELHKVAELKADQALLMIKKGRADFYIYNASTIRFYIKTQKLTGLTLHDGFFPEEFMLLGFSRKSVHYNEIKNKKYNPNKPLSPGNFPVILDPKCLAAKLHQTLKEMYKDGTTQKIYDKYYK